MSEAKEVTETSTFRRESAVTYVSVPSSKKKKDENPIYRSELLIYPQTAKLSDFHGSRSTKVQDLINEKEKEIRSDRQFDEKIICFICNEEIIRGNVIEFGENKGHKNCFNCSKCAKCLIGERILSIPNCKICCFECYEKDFAARCEQCQKAISTGKSINFNGKIFHLDCFCCHRCGERIDHGGVEIFNDQICCLECYKKYFAPQCSKCLKGIVEERSIIFNGNKYHINCFRCYSCNQIIREKEFARNNGEVCCLECYDRLFAKKCFQCSQSISNGKSILAENNQYHPECFRCFRCHQMINENKYRQYNSKRCCIQCFEEHYALRCEQCQQIIFNEKKINFQGKDFHSNCFTCSICDHTLNNDQFYQNNGKPCCIQCYENIYALKCCACSTSIIGQYTIFEEKPFHIQCFRCSICHRIIESTQTFQHKNELIFCSTCAH